MSWKQTVQKEGDMLSAWINGSTRRYAIYYWPVSGFVEVWSFIKVGNGYHQCPLPVKCLKPVFNTDGHPTVVLTLAQGQKPKNFRLYKLIYIHFIGDISAKQQVRHSNDIKTDLRRCNLIPGTRKQNMQDAKVNGLLAWRTKPPMTDDDVRECRKLYLSRQMTWPELAERYHRSCKHIQRICTGKRRKNVP